METMDGGEAQRKFPVGTVIAWTQGGTRPRQTKLIGDDGTFCVLVEYIGTVLEHDRPGSHMCVGWHWPEDATGYQARTPEGWVHGGISPAECIVLSLPRDCPMCSREAPIPPDDYLCRECRKAW